MSRYFQMTYAEDEDYAPYGVAYAPSSNGLFVIPPTGTKVESWVPMTLRLRDGKYPDYLSNDIGVRLCSTRLKEVLDSARSDKDPVQWLEVDVKGPGDSNRPYFILHFPESLMVINPAKSIMAGDMVVRAVLDEKALRGHDLFALPGDTGRRTFVSQGVKTAIEVARLTGMAFAAAKVV